MCDRSAPLVSRSATKQGASRNAPPRHEGRSLKQGVCSNLGVRPGAGGAVGGACVPVQGAHTSNVRGAAKNKVRPVRPRAPRALTRTRTRAQASLHYSPSLMRRGALDPGAPPRGRRRPRRRTAAACGIGASPSTLRCAAAKRGASPSPACVPQVRDERAARVRREPEGRVTAHNNSNTTDSYITTTNTSGTATDNSTSTSSDTTERVPKVETVTRLSARARTRNISIEPCNVAGAPARRSKPAVDEVVGPSSASSPSAADSDTRASTDTATGDRSPMSTDTATGDRSPVTGEPDSRSSDASMLQRVMMPIVAGIAPRFAPSEVAR